MACPKEPAKRKHPKSVNAPEKNVVHGCPRIPDEDYGRTKRMIHHRWTWMNMAARKRTPEGIFSTDERGLGMRTSEERKG
jgi:hypothetical protein